MAWIILQIACVLAFGGFLMTSAVETTTNKAIQNPTNSNLTNSSEQTTDDISNSNSSECNTTNNPNILLTTTHDSVRQANETTSVADTVTSNVVSTSISNTSTQDSSSHLATDAATEHQTMPDDTSNHKPEYSSSYNKGYVESKKAGQRLDLGDYNVTRASAEQESNSESEMESDNKVTYNVMDSIEEVASNETKIPTKTVSVSESSADSDDTSIPQESGVTTTEAKGKNSETTTLDSTVDVIPTSPADRLPESKSTEIKSTRKRSVDDVDSNSASATAKDSQETGEVTYPIHNYTTITSADTSTTIHKDVPSIKDDSMNASDNVTSAKINTTTDSPVEINGTESSTSGSINELNSRDTQSENITSAHAIKTETDSKVKLDEDSEATISHISKENSTLSSLDKSVIASSPLPSRSTRKRRVSPPLNRNTSHISLTSSIPSEDPDVGTDEPFSVDFPEHITVPDSELWPENLPPQYDWNQFSMESSQESLIHHQDDATHSYEHVTDEKDDLTDHNADSEAHGSQTDLPSTSNTENINLPKVKNTSIDNIDIMVADGSSNGQLSGSQPMSKITTLRNEETDSEKHIKGIETSSYGTAVKEAPSTSAVLHDTNREHFSTSGVSSEKISSEAISEASNSEASTSVAKLADVPIDSSSVLNGAIDEIRVNNASAEEPENMSEIHSAVKQDIKVGPSDRIEKSGINTLNLESTHMIESVEPEVITEIVVLAQADKFARSSTVSAASTLHVNVADQSHEILVTPVTSHLYGNTSPAVNEARSVVRISPSESSNPTENPVLGAVSDHMFNDMMQNDSPVGDHFEQSSQKTEIVEPNKYSNASEEEKLSQDVSSKIVDQTLTAIKTTEPQTDQSVIRPIAVKMTSESSTESASNTDSSQVGDASSTPIAKTQNKADSVFDPNSSSLPQTLSPIFQTKSSSSEYQSTPQTQSTGSVITEPVKLASMNQSKPESTGSSMNVSNPITNEDNSSVEIMQNKTEYLSLDVTNITDPNAASKQNTPTAAPEQPSASPEPSTAAPGPKIRKPRPRLNGASDQVPTRSPKPFISTPKPRSTTVGERISSMFNKKRPRIASITSSTTQRTTTLFNIDRIHYANRVPDGMIPYGPGVSIEAGTTTTPVPTTTEEPYSEEPFTELTQVPSLSSEDDVTLVKMAGTVVVRKGIRWDDQLYHRNSKKYKMASTDMHLRLERLLRTSSIATRLWSIEIDGFSEALPLSGKVIVDFVLSLIKEGDENEELKLLRIFNDKLKNNTFGPYTVDPDMTEFKVLEEERRNKPTEAPSVEPPIPQWAIAVIVIGAASLIFIVLFAAVTMYGRHHMRRRYSSKLSEEEIEKSGDWESKMAAAYENLAADTIYDAEDGSIESMKRSYLVD